MDVATTGTTTGTVVALGDPALLVGYALAGARLVPATGTAVVRRAFDDLDDDVAVVVLTPDAATALGPRREAPGAPLTVVIPA